MNYLTPERRKAIYSVLAVIGGLLAYLGVVNSNLLAGWLGTADAVLSVLALILASIKARRVDITATYAAMVLLVGALKVQGILDDGAASHIVDILAALAGALPLLVAALRTTAATPTGEPKAEFDAGAAVAPPVPPSEGDVPPGV